MLCRGEATGIRCRLEGLSRSSQVRVLEVRWIGLFELLCEQIVLFESQRFVVLIPMNWLIDVRSLQHTHVVL